MAAKRPPRPQTQAAAGKQEAARAPFPLGRLCGSLALGYLCLCLFLLARRGREQEEDPRASFREDRSCTAKDGSCSAGGAQWWAEADLGFSEHGVLHVDTFNFNRTVTNTSDLPLLIAFFDPRSRSFLDLRPQLQETAEVLARHEASGAPIGRLGVCDVTVNTYLGHEEAPELESGWQEARESSFKFDMPRFYPLIMVLYQEGVRVGEYTDVVSAKPIAAFFRRLGAVKGGALLTGTAALEQLLEGPGPFALGCGLEDGSDEHLAFKSTANELHGHLIFGLAPQAVCEEVLGPLSPSRPRVVWVDGSSRSRVRSFTGSAPPWSPKELGEWLSRQRPELLEEMTPDTSHKYLDRPEPLLVFLVDPGDKAAWGHGASLLGGVEHLLAGKVQLVWSDCLVFGAQFNARQSCPVFVVVDTESMTWKKMPLKSLGGGPKQGGGPAGNNASTRLLSWLKKVTGVRLDGPSAAAAAKAKTQKQREEAEPQGQKTTRGKAKRPRRGKPSGVPEKDHDADEAVNAEEGADDGDPSDMVRKGLTQGFEEDFMDAMPVIDESADVAFLRTHYDSALRQLLQLQVSYEEKYGRHLEFDFSDLEKAQSLHPAMRALASSPTSVQRQVQDPDKLKKLRRIIEWTHSFEHNESRVPNARRILHRGYDLVRGVFLRLFRHLHRHAEAGTLGIPPAEQRAVERRSASGLSVREFVEQYAKPGLPVIITGLNITEEEPWTMDFFRERCNVSAPYQRRNPLKWSWGRLEHAGDLPLPEFLDTFTSNATRRSWYLHDWSLPKECPEAFGPPPYPGFTVPKYFAGDYFQRAVFHGFQHAWPSLFVGSEETQSAMHIDNGGTNFWLYLLSGRKEWRFFSRRDLVNVYAAPLHAHFLPDAFSPNLTKFPLLRYAEMFVGVQEPGDIMFIPGGNPHAVRNLAPIHGVSMNYVDASNVWIFLWHMLAEGNFRSFEMFTDGVTFPHGLRSDQQPVRFGEWKSTKWKDLSYDIQ